MSASQPTALQSTNSKKVQLFNDIFYYLAIVSAYQFISLTYRTHILQSCFDFNYRNYLIMANLLSVYIILLVSLKILIHLRISAQQLQKQPLSIQKLIKIIKDIHLAIWLNILADLVPIEWGKSQEIRIKQLCYLLSWLIVAQISKIASCFFLYFGNLSVFAATIDVFALLAILVKFVGFDLFLYI